MPQKLQEGTLWKKKLFQLVISTEYEELEDEEKREEKKKRSGPAASRPRKVI